jgi:hypothetical protein
MKVFLRTTMAAAVGILMAGTAFAENVHAEKRYDRYLDNHPRAARKLEQNPNLVNDKHYMRNHPEFREFMATHPHLKSYEKKHSQ